VRVSDLRIPTADEAKKTILHAGIALPESYVLFIGSAYGPNNSAADFLHQLSRTFARRGIDLSVVVAGTCHTPLADGLFHSLGLVSEEVKAALYVLARAVVAPLVGGTGTSLKIVEAMSMGKVVIGTNSAFRGLGVTHGENALLEDDLSSYDRLLPQFLEDTDRFLHMAREARKLAGQFDYRLTYRHYVDYLESLDVAPVGTVRGVAGWQR
jgi:glycosyltransferase involved in cell wall biosynthesis